MQRILPALFLILLVSCDDPAPVGVDLVDEQSGSPFVLDVPSPDLTLSPVQETTGNASRSLFGSVDDPDLGALEAISYFDFATTGTLGASFESNPVESASLLLATNYVYGDSAADLTISIRSVVAAWTGSGARSDTTLQVGDLVTTSTQNRRSVTLAIPLPDTWVARWDTTLRSTTFDDAFFGFEVSAPEASSIVGASILGTSIRAVAGGDTVFYPVARSLTRFLDTGGSGQTGSPVLFQDGRGRAASFSIDLETDATALVLNRGIVRVPVDTSLTVNAPAGFARPAIRQLQLDWITRAGTRTPIALASKTASGHFDFQSDQLHDSLRVFLQGRSGLDRLEVRVPNSQNSVSVLRFPSAAVGPRALLTVTPIQ